jgi:hypothetical protein
MLYDHEKLKILAKFSFSNKIFNEKFRSFEFSLTCAFSEFSSSFQSLNAPRSFHSVPLIAKSHFQSAPYSTKCPNLPTKFINFENAEKNVCAFSFEGVRKNAKKHSVDKNDDKFQGLFRRRCSSCAVVVVLS